MLFFYIIYINLKPNPPQKTMIYLRGLSFLLAIPFTASTFIFSCAPNTKRAKNEKTFSFETLPKSISLQGKKKYYPELKMPYTLFTNNDLLIVGESRRTYAEYPPIHLIHSQKMDYLGAKGVIGFGPGELSDVAGMDAGSNENTFWVYSAMEKRFSEFSLEDTASLSSNQIKQEGDFFMAMAMKFSSDSTVMCRMVNDPFRFVEFSLDGRRIKNYGKWKDILVRKDFTDYMMADLHLGYFQGNQRNQTYAYASAYRDRLEILDKKSEQIFLVDGPYNFIPEFTVATSGGKSNGVIVDINEPMAYAAVEVSDDYIYGLYCGRTFREVREGSEYATEIYVFDLQGTIICELKLDTSIRALAVNEQAGKLYGITTDEDPGIAVFDLPNLK